MSQIEAFDIAAPPVEERRARYDVDYTPPAIVRAVYDTLWHVSPVKRVLCPAAGAGVWAMEARERWPEAEILAVEVREEERSNLERWCDRVVIRDIRDALCLLSYGFDVIADNPAFSLLPQGDCPHDQVSPQGRCQSCGARKSQAEALRAFVANLRPLLSPHGRLVMYWTSNLGQRSPDATAILREHVPVEQLRIPWPVQHRRDQGVDSRSYSAFVWGSGRRDPSEGWRCRDLLDLAREDCRWAVVPGTEAAP